MLDTYNLRFYKNNVRVTPHKLNDADVRLFYKQLQSLMHSYESKYHDNLNNESLLIVFDERIVYRRRSFLKLMKIKTIQDMMDYLEIEPTNIPKYIFANNMIVTDTDMKLSDIYVLQFYTHQLGPTYTR